MGLLITVASLMTGPVLAEPETNSSFEMAASGLAWERGWLVPAWTVDAAVLRAGETTGSRDPPIPPVETPAMECLLGKGGASLRLGIPRTCSPVIGKWEEKFPAAGGGAGAFITTSASGGGLRLVHPAEMPRASTVLA